MALVYTDDMWNTLMVLEAWGISEALYNAIDNKTALNDLDPSLKLELIEKLIPFSKRDDFRQNYKSMSKKEKAKVQQYYIDELEALQLMEVTDKEAIKSLVKLSFYATAYSQ